MKITDKELTLLSALRAANTKRPSDQDNASRWVTHLRAMGHWWRPSDLQRIRYISLDAPEAGLHRTAASLVRKGLVARRKIQGMIHYQPTTAGMKYLADLGQPSADDQRQDRRQARLPERTAAVSRPDPAEWHGISRVAGHTPADCPGPVMCDYAKSQPAREYAREYWSASGSTRLAKIISGVCGVSQAAGETLAGISADAPGGAYRFETETRVAGHAKLGISTRYWRASRWTSGLANPGPDGWKLERLEDGS
jgi:hypothetical protein